MPMRVFVVWELLAKSRNFILQGQKADGGALGEKAYLLNLSVHCGQFWRGGLGSMVYCVL
jgi:hypothetical protein